MHPLFKTFSDFHLKFIKEKDKELRRAKIIGALTGRAIHKWFYMGGVDTGYSFDDLLKCSKCGKEVRASTFADWPSYKWCDEGRK